MWVGRRKWKNGLFRFCISFKLCVVVNAAEKSSINFERLQNVALPDVLTFFPPRTKIAFQVLKEFAAAFQLYHHVVFQKDDMK